MRVRQLKTDVSSNANAKIKRFATSVDMHTTCFKTHTRQSCSQCMPQVAPQGAHYYERQTAEAVTSILLCVCTGEQAADGEATARANQQLPRPAQGHPHGRHQKRGMGTCQNHMTL